MKAVAYNINPFEREFLAKANQKKHDITLIANQLSYDTINYADGKDAVIVYENGDMTTAIIEKLASLGVKYMVTCSAQMDTAKGEAKIINGIKIAHISADLLQTRTLDALQEIAVQTISNLDFWQQNKCLGEDCACAKDCKTILSRKN
ncbi:hypothetical protein JN11_01820 [Mucilaginibacter frigoritolerans]|jgi:lactate dehydrogenase-like 2-hydroxyacid dehydrogenase|uniref:D-lactate dehydrogenase n=1 Tax=Mucilaginibacter frigoritolerans TaxID=652788 RepID=A0A562U7S6_9SPHI|nr:lactate dehydrogenase [Mucilaginibacter frigoritolerans]TWJ01669.1 hypothetical protein JN11_01820 [Mucilaginibacter frigoritolerans]